MLRPWDLEKDQTGLTALRLKTLLQLSQYTLNPYDYQEWRRIVAAPPHSFGMPVAWLV